MLPLPFTTQGHNIKSRLDLEMIVQEREIRKHNEKKQINKVEDKKSLFWMHQHSPSVQKAKKKKKLLLSQASQSCHNKIIRCVGSELHVQNPESIRSVK